MLSHVFASRSKKLYFDWRKLDICVDYSLVFEDDMWFAILTNPRFYSEDEILPAVQLLQNKLVAIDIVPNVADGFRGKKCDVSVCDTLCEFEVTGCVSVNIGVFKTQFLMSYKRR